MTEQEKREKAIKEMIEIAFPTYRTEQDVIAIQRLYDAGYRKAEEVQKETAKKSRDDLLNMIKNNTDLNASVFGWTTDFILTMIKQYFKTEFGVEVEE